MVYENHLWYGPAYLTECGVQADKQAKSSGEKLSAETVKVINETRTGALFALGLSMPIRNLFSICPGLSAIFSEFSIFSQLGNSNLLLMAP